jgi:Zn-dependent protease
MTPKYSLGRLAGLELSYRRSVFPAFIFLWASVSAVGLWILDLPSLSALTIGLVTAFLHYGSDLWHQFGHAAAARRTGYPMNGILFWGVLSTSLYPDDEGNLPGRIHITRALGGPASSFALSLAAGLLALALKASGGIAYWTAVFLWLDNLLVLCLGALLPLGFTDGSTLLYWMRKRVK